MSEFEALVLAQSGDSKGFGILYSLHHNNVLNRCRQILKNEEEAEDLAQEVFLLLWQKINLFKHESSFHTWLYRLTTNKVVGYLRYKKIRPCGAGDAPETYQEPDQLTRLEILEALDNLTEMERLCLEGEVTGNTLRYHGGANYLRSAAKELREVLA